MIRRRHSFFWQLLVDMLVIGLAGIVFAFMLIAWVWGA